MARSPENATVAGIVAWLMVVLFIILLVGSAYLRAKGG